MVKRHGVCTGDHRRLVAAAGQLDLESLGALTTQEEGESMGGEYDDMDDDDGFMEDEDPFGGAQ
ncbi:MAG: hypothetical protein C4554_04770 [Dethiobacter sp.]|nr:MAG: hypothetical protein C4554_04770 [Dethiobacter sp.]